MCAKIYLDRSSLARPSPHLIGQMKLYQEWIYHPAAQRQELSTAIQNATTTLYSFFGADKGAHFILAPSGNKATLIAYVNAIIDFLSKNKKNHILTVESSPFVGKRLEKLGYVKRTVVLNKNGELTPENLDDAISPQTGLVSLSWANCYTGTIQPIQKLAEVCQKHGVLFHVDASNIIGKYHFVFADLPIDYLTFEGALLHAPQGSGGLFINHKTPFEPLVPEVPAHAHYNISTFIGLGIAFEELKQSGAFHYMEIARLRDLLEKGVQSGLQNIKILFQNTNRLPNTSVIVFPGIANELLAFHLKESGLIVSCYCEDQRLEDVLITFGISLLEARSAISFILSRNITEKEIQRSIAVIVDCAQKCQTFSKGVV